MKKSPLYITTAIPYVNSAPHIGNAMDYLLADIWARHQRQLGHEVRFQVGTDEHGDKIAKKALEAGMPTQAYVDQNYLKFQHFIDKFNISYTDFIRTTDIKHMAAVQYIWKQLAPYLYKAPYEGWYCQGCESFVTDKEATANGGICPDHKTHYQRLKEDNYFLKLSAMTERIRQAITTQELKIIPENRAKEFLNLIADGLEDISVSRPKKSVAWGVPVPDDPSQVMYVWIDALANYLTTIGYPNQPNWRDYWPASVQVVGKDILRFHAGIWPAMLLMLDLPLPKVLLVHGHIQVDGVKMSKTIGNVVNPLEILDNYGTDAFRYFFARHIPTQDDGDFTWERFEKSYNNELGNDLGNLVSRILNMLNKYQAGVINQATATKHDESAYFEAMTNFNFTQALEEVWAYVRSLNQYIDTVKPWEIAKRRVEDPEAEHHLTEVLDYLTTSIQQIATMLTPFMPETADKISQLFAPGVIQQPITPLFPKIYLHTPNSQAKHAN